MTSTDQIVVSIGFFGYFSRSILKSPHINDVLLLYEKMSYEYTVLVQHAYSRFYLLKLMKNQFFGKETRFLQTNNFNIIFFLSREQEICKAHRIVSVWFRHLYSEWKCHPHTNVLELFCVIIRRFMSKLECKVFVIVSNRCF